MSQHIIATLTAAANGNARVIAGITAAVEGSQPDRKDDYVVESAAHAANIIHRGELPPATLARAVQTVAELAALDADGEACLPRGRAHFSERHVFTALTFWAGKANQRGEEVPFPKAWEDKLPSAQEIYDWGCRVVNSSYKEEGSNAPNITLGQVDGNVYRQDGIPAPAVRLTWSGTWTSSRWVDLVVEETQEGGLWLTLEWDSGTGRPSTFLGIEGLLPDAADWAVLPKEESEQAA
jgi:hypothetical protein